MIAQATNVCIGNVCLTPRGVVYIIGGLIVLAGFIAVMTWQTKHAARYACTRCGHVRMMHDKRLGCIVGLSDDDPSPRCTCSAFVSPGAPTEPANDELRGS